MSIRNLFILYIQYDKDRYQDSLPILNELLENLKGWQWQGLILNNKVENLAPEQRNPHWVEMGGDNRVHEFSAWNKGLAWIKLKNWHYDCVLLVTDAFPAYRDNYKKIFSSRMLDFICQHQAVAGIIDFPPPRSADFELQHWLIKYWLRTSFVVLPASVIEILGNLVTFDKVDKFFGEFQANQPFSQHAEVSLAYAEYLTQWLTQDWHSAFPLTQESWPRFKDKIRSILNEHALTARLIESQVPLFDLFYLKKFLNLKKVVLLPESLQNNMLTLDVAQQKLIRQVGLPSRLLKKALRPLLRRGD